MNGSFESFAAQWRHPDVPAYEQQKGVQVIAQESHALPQPKMDACTPRQPQVLGNHMMGDLWNRYYGPRLMAAMQGDHRLWPAFFPGHTVPGPGACSGTRVVGTLALTRFRHLLELGGGTPHIGPIRRHDDIRRATTEDAQIVDWPWRYVTQPRLRMIQPACVNDIATAEDVTRLKWWIIQQLRQHIQSGHIREALTLIRHCWSPNTRTPLWAPETVSAARTLLLWATANQADGHDRLLSCAFEIESILSHIQYSWPLNIGGYGEYNGVWLEVGRLPMCEIRCTELAVTKRVLHELINVRTKGFAPIVVNEYGCDTDGTHRLMGSWMWNLLRALDGTAIDLASDETQRRVGDFIAYHRIDMGEIIVRETLRSLAEMLRDERATRTLMQEVVPFVGHYHPITHLPVLLLLEYSCGAVIKGPYDEGIASHRVDPVIYEQMARDSSLTLPARGPYHLTDRAPLPWFEVLETV